MEASGRTNPQQPARTPLLPRRLLPLRWTWQPNDAHPWVTRLAGIGVALAVPMAVFGLPPVDLHGLTHHAGVMDPFCGGTRSVRLAARGDWSGSWRYNPIGIPVVLGGLAVLVRAFVGRLTGQWLTVRSELVHRYPRVSAAVAGVLLAALEVNQQTHAALLLAPPVTTAPVVGRRPGASGQRLRHVIATLRHIMKML